MAITRQGNFLGQQRVDVPDLRSIESAVANDFDLLAGIVMTHKESVVITGFTIDTTSAFGAPASSLILRTAGGVLIHWGATEAGSLIQVADDQADEILNTSNARVQGSFASAAMNYIGIDYLRSADAATSDTTKFMTADTAQEVARSVPKARTLDYRITISTSPFSLTSNVDPIAKVLTDSSGNVVSVTDARNLFGRLAPGGDVPNPSAAYVWADATRRENANTYAPSSTTANPFQGGDKGIHSLKDWMDAMMNLMWEAKSGQFWYSPTTRDGIKLGCSSSVISATGDNFDWTAPPTLKWKGLIVTFENSDANHNVVTDNATVGVTFNDGQCLYVDIDRSQVATLTAQVGTLTSLPAPTVPGSRVIICWRIGTDLYIRDRGFDITRTIPVATTTVPGIVKLNATPGAPSAPVVISVQANGTASITATGGNAPGFTATGNGTGTGIVGNGGAGTNNIGVAGFGSANTGNIGVYGQGNLFSGIGVVGVATGGNGLGGSFTGFGFGVGVFGQGGNGGGSAGGSFSGGTNGNGVSGVGAGTGVGVNGTGGTSAGGHGGVFAAGIGSNANGAVATGNGTGSGGVFTGGATGAGLTATGTTTGVGATITGGNNAGGIVAAAGGGNHIGVQGTGAGTQPGIRGLGGATGNGGTFTGGGSGGFGIQATGGLASSAGVFTGGATGAAGIVTTGSNSQPGIISSMGGSGTASTHDAIESSQNIHLAGSNPAGTTAFSNRLTPINLVKAWACFSVAVGGGSIVVYESFNISSITISGNNYICQLAAPVSNSPFACFANIGGGNYYCNAAPVFSGPNRYIYVTARTSATNFPSDSPANVGSFGGVMSTMAFGAQ